MSALDFATLLAAEKRKMQQQLQKNPSPNHTHPSTDKKQEQTGEASVECCTAFSRELRISPHTNARLTDHRLTSPVDSLFYIPQFLSEDEGAELMGAIYNMPPRSWTQLSHRRLQTYGGTPDMGGMLKKPLPMWLQPVIRRLENAGVFGTDTIGLPNHVLLNEYKCGQGIMPHKDGPLYSPRVAILSLGSTCALEFWDSHQHSRASPRKPPRAAILCEPFSLVVFEGDAYHTTLHGIAERTCDWPTECCNKSHISAGRVEVEFLPREGTRVSLTIRQVLRVKEGEEALMTPSCQWDARAASVRFAQSISEE